MKLPSRIVEVTNSRNLIDCLLVLKPAQRRPPQSTRADLGLQPYFLPWYCLSEWLSDSGALGIRESITRKAAPKAGQGEHGGGTREES